MTLVLHYLDGRVRRYTGELDPLEVPARVGVFREDLPMLVAIDERSSLLRFTARFALVCSEGPVAVYREEKGGTKWRRLSDRLTCD